MSKNVAVFVDVANIFYAAKAAGVDIDYVTLLKAATAGRDFVRAYAYTGLDPDNENQRQFHTFLARNGYRVVSKDIRKYGDGRIKANLDIELVVDLMRLSRNLDVAVVVSGDGDFAPAIRAVQETGVRVEVISFRGNTSSDLIDVADSFTDITQLARVDKGSTRSGRRVAAEGDLSMTEVPEKETEGGPRRRRGGRGRGERDEVAVRPVVAEAGAALPANVIVLPGEKLSRAPSSTGNGDEPAETYPEGYPAAEDGELDEPGMPATASGFAGAGVDAGADADGRRRRRRRGGRGRGRGQRDAELVPADEARVESPSAEIGDEDEFEELQPAPRPHVSTFGSVWDTQLGVPSAAPITSASDIGDEDVEDEDEPEIPEYLLAERRQRQQRGRGRPGPRGARAGYQAAVDRERYGRGGAGSGGGFAPRQPARGRPEAPRPQRPHHAPHQQRDRMPREPRREERYERTESAPSGEPWSEVPAELESLLRAQLASRAPRIETTPARAEFAATAPPEEAEATYQAVEPEVIPAPSVPEVEVVPLLEPVGKAPADPLVAPRTRGRRRTAAESTAEAAPPAVAPARRRGRPAATAAAPDEGSALAASGTPGSSGDAPVSSEEPTPARARSRRRTQPDAAPSEPTGAAAGTEAPAEPPQEAPTRRRAAGRRSTAAAAPAAADETGTPDVAEPPARPTRRRRSTAEAIPPAGDDAGG